ncbi:MAG: cyclic nucleotide-binding domain-containing protein [Acidobacteriota bacterium]
MKTVFKATSSKDPVKHQSLRFSGGDFIFREGDLGTEMFIIVEGVVHLVKGVAGEDLVLSRLEKGDFFGEMAVIESAARSAAAVAETDVTLLPINAARFDEMLKKNPEIALRMIRKYARRLEEANALLDQLASRTVDPDHSASPSEIEVPAAPAARPARPHRLMHQGGRSFLFGRALETTIGRSDPVTGIMPDIDLTPLDTDRSVSRRHAKILQREGQFFVLEEVGTINGTFVNEERIPTGQPVGFSNGDVLRVGLIEMKVIFES